MGETQEEDKENIEKVSIFSCHYSRTRFIMKLETQASIHRVFLTVTIIDVFPGLSCYIDPDGQSTCGFYSPWDTFKICLSVPFISV